MSVFLTENHPVGSVELDRYELLALCYLIHLASRSLELGVFRDPGDELIEIIDSLLDKLDVLAEAALFPRQNEDVED